MSFDPTGYTLAHEHLHIDLSGFKNNVDCRLDQYAFICQEMNDLMTRGVRNVIEMTNRYMGRNAQFMLDVMRETGINVVACTGYYQDAFFPEHVATRSVQELAQEMVDEIEQGIDGTACTGSTLPSARVLGNWEQNWRRRWSMKLNRVSMAP